MKQFLLLSVGLVLGLMVLSCDTSNDDQHFDHAIRVTGTVYAWVCEPRDPYNDSIDYRYSPRTERKALVRWLREDGRTFAGYTDDSSRYNLVIDSGTYTAILETDFDFPETLLNLHLDRDTTVDFETTYLFVWADTITALFISPSTADTIGAVAEMNQLSRVNGLIGKLLDLPHARREVLPQMPGTSRYQIPILAGHKIWQVEDAIVWARSLHYEEFPSNFVILAASIACLD